MLLLHGLNLVIQLKFGHKSKPRAATLIEKKTGLLNPLTPQLINLSTYQPINLIPSNNLPQSPYQ